VTTKTFAEGWTQKISINFELHLKNLVMKKIFIIAIACFCLTTVTNAQDKALGVRLGAGLASGGEVSFQLDKGTANRIEADLGFIGNDDHTGIALTGVYQWTWDLSELGDGFRWYAGPGVGVRLFDGLGLGIHGQIGIEYKFEDAPIRLSIDTRPGWYFGGESGIDGGLAISARYTF
jgi:hypothetical protein